MDYEYDNINNNSNEEPHTKRMRLDDDNTKHSGTRPFSSFLSSSFRRSKKHPVLSDKKLIVYNLKGFFFQIHTYLHVLPPLPPKHQTWSTEKKNKND